MLTVGSLFSGIGGWDLGLERTGGFRTDWFCEQDPFCRSVLAKHWPGVPRFVDITRVGAGRDWEPRRVDVLCGGFPCQDLSDAGAGAGLSGARSGLWSEYARLIGELRPSYVLVENVSALLRRGFGTVLGDLAALGMHAEWDCLPASAFGAPHQRDRVWLVAYADSVGRPEGTGEPYSPPVGREGYAQLGWCDWWDAEPGVRRVATGVPGAMDRRRALGNALVPPIAEWIGHRILAHEAVRAERDTATEGDDRAAA